MPRIQSKRHLVNAELIGAFRNHGFIPRGVQSAISRNLRVSEGVVSEAKRALLDKGIIWEPGPHTNLNSKFAKVASVIHYMSKTTGELHLRDFKNIADRTGASPDFVNEVYAKLFPKEPPGKRKP